MPYVWGSEHVGFTVTVLLSFVVLGFWSLASTLCSSLPSSGTRLGMPPSSMGYATPSLSHTSSLVDGSYLHHESNINHILSSKEYRLILYSTQHTGSIYSLDTSKVLLREGRRALSSDLDRQDTERKLLKIQLFSLAAWRHRSNS